MLRPANVSVALRCWARVFRARSRRLPAQRNEWQWPVCNPAVTGCTTTGNGVDYNAAQKPNDYDVVNEAFHSRFPRYDLITITKSASASPARSSISPMTPTLFTLDALVADFAVKRKEEYLGSAVLQPQWHLQPGQRAAGAPALLANTLGSGTINIIDYTVDELHNNLNATVGHQCRPARPSIASTILTRAFGGDAGRQPRLRRRTSRCTACSAGRNRNHYNPIQTTLTMDYNCTAGDLRHRHRRRLSRRRRRGGAGTAAQPLYGQTMQAPTSFMPALSYGNVDVTSPNGWFLSQIRERANYDYNAYRTIQLDGEYKIDNGFNLRARRRLQELHLPRPWRSSRTNGTTAALDSFIPDRHRSARALAQHHPARHAARHRCAGRHATTWLVPNINKANAQFHIFDQTAREFRLAGHVGTARGALHLAGSGCGAFLLGPQQMLTSNGSVNENDYRRLADGGLGHHRSAGCRSAAISAAAMP